MLNSNTIANKKDASARAKYVGCVDCSFIFYLHKIIYKTFFLSSTEILHHDIDNLIRHPYKPLYRRFIGHVFLDALHVEYQGLDLVLFGADGHFDLSAHFAVDLNGHYDHVLGGLGCIPVRPTLENEIPPPEARMFP